jgi:hypothetical protein
MSMSPYEALKAEYEILQGRYDTIKMKMFEFKDHYELLEAEYERLEYELGDMKKCYERAKKIGMGLLTAHQQLLEKQPQIQYIPGLILPERLGPKRCPHCREYKIGSHPYRPIKTAAGTTSMKQICSNCGWGSVYHFYVATSPRYDNKVYLKMPCVLCKEKENRTNISLQTNAL